MSKRTPTSGRAGRLSKLLDSASPTLSFSETDSGYENLDASNLSAYVPRPRTDSERVVARARFQTEDYEELREADAVRRQANIELEEAHTKHDKEMREVRTHNRAREGRHAPTSPSQPTNFCHYYHLLQLAHSPKT